MTRPMPDQIEEIRAVLEFVRPDEPGELPRLLEKGSLQLTGRERASPPIPESTVQALHAGLTYLLRSMQRPPLAHGVKPAARTTGAEIARAARVSFDAQREVWRTWFRVEERFGWVPVSDAELADAQNISLEAEDPLPVSALREAHEDILWLLQGAEALVSMWSAGVVQIADSPCPQCGKFVLAVLGRSRTYCNTRCSGAWNARQYRERKKRKSPQQ